MRFYMKMLLLSVFLCVLFSGCKKEAVSPLPEIKPEPITEFTVKTEERDGKVVYLLNQRPLTIHCKQLSQVYQDAMAVYTDGSEYFFEMEIHADTDTSFIVYAIEKYAKVMKQSVEEVRERLKSNDFYEKSEKIVIKEKYDTSWNDFELPKEITPKTDGTDLLYERKSLIDNEIYLDSLAFPIKLCVVIDEKFYALANTKEWYTLSAISDEVKIIPDEVNPYTQSIVFGLNDEEAGQVCSSYVGYLSPNNDLFFIAYTGKELDPDCIWNKLKIKKINNKEVKAYLSANDLSELY